jgi:HD-like signal output (HDOD) protein
MSKQPTILFVDDEPSILKALRRLFIDEDWQMFFAAGGEEGLQILKDEAVDLIISDVRMPGMDGVEFLTRAKELYPGIVRIFLSGYAEKESVAKALAQGCAQQILPKPWDETELREVIHTTLRQCREQQQGQRPLQALINSLSNLPPQPTVYRDLKACLADRGNFSIDQVGDIIRSDAAMAADLLHWANSAVFGQRRQVDTIKKAILLLGIDIVESLVISESINRKLGNLAKQAAGFDSQGFQRHSMGSAIVARLLAETLAAEQPKLADHAFIAGLLHDIGLLAEVGLFPDRFAEVQQAVSEKNLRLVEAEIEVLQTSHPEVGAVLAEWWSLPAFIVHAIRWHEEPLKASADQEIVGLVAMANLLASEFGFDIPGDDLSPAVEQSLRARYPLTTEQLKELKDRCEESLQVGG